MLDNNILNAENIFLNERLTSKQSVFERVAEIAMNNNITKSKTEIINGLLERENQSTTGFLDGFAIPHVLSKEVSIPSVIILKTTDGIDWQSLDGRLTSFFIALLIPGDNQNHHLKLLSSIARLLMDEGIREKLILANSSKEVRELLMPVVQN